MNTEANIKHTSNPRRTLDSTCSDFQPKVWRGSLRVLSSAEQTLSAYHMEDTELYTILNTYKQHANNPEFLCSEMIAQQEVARL